MKRIKLFLARIFNRRNIVVNSKEEYIKLIERNPRLDGRIIIAAA